MQTSTIRPATLIGISNVAERSNVYAFMLPLFLCAVGCICQLFPTPLVFGISTGTMTVMAVGCAADLLFGTFRISPFRLLAIAQLLGYGMTSFFTWFNVLDYPGGLAAFAGSDINVLCSGIAVVLFATALLLATGEFIGKDLKLHMVEILNLPQMTWIVIVAVSIILIAFAKGALGFMGESLVDSQRSLIGAVAFWLIAPSFALTLGKVLQKSPSKAARITWWCLLGVQAGLAVPLGRRVFMYTLFVAFVVDRFRNKKKKKVTFKMGVVAAGVVGLIYISSICFLYLRVATYEFGEEPRSLSQLVSAGYGIYKTGDVKEIQSSLQENAIERGFILQFLADLLFQTGTHDTAGGGDFVNSVKWTIPSVLWKNKQEELPPVEEEQANLLFGTDYPDQANSLLTAGTVDFGSVGAILYPTILAIVITGYFGFFLPRISFVASAVVLIAGIYVLLNVEADLTGYIVYMRDSLLFALGIYILSRFRLDVNKLRRLE